jgi:hypothetical protein
MTPDRQRYYDMGWRHARTGKPLTPQFRLIRVAREIPAEMRGVYTRGYSDGGGLTTPHVSGGALTANPRKSTPYPR